MSAYDKYLNDPYARTFVVPRNVKFERNNLRERLVDESFRANDNSLPPGSAAYANNHAIPLPGGQVYVRSGVSSIDMARRTSQFANRY